MIKTIKTNQVRLGMYVHDLNCSWMEHGFLQNHLLIRTETDLERIYRLGVQDILIDTTKGCDVSDELAQAATESAARPAASAEAQPAQEPAAESLASERARAKRIHNEAIGVIRGLMDDVRLGQQVDLARADPVIHGMVDSIFRNQDALLGLSRIRHMDRYTFEHSVNVAVLMISFARSLDLDRALIHDIGMGALLHDIGKVLVPNAILNKPGKLSDEEFAVMRGHVLHSREILARSPGTPRAALAVASEHHERVDGSGYPDGKRAEQITAYGKMAAIVDVYDAITADRVYHKGMSPHQALGKMMEWSATHFDRALIQHFIRCVGIYPVGTLVRLASGRLGVVVETSREGLRAPVVRVFMDARHRQYLPIQDIDLAHLPKGSDERILNAESAQQWGIHPEEFLVGQ